MDVINDKTFYDSEGEYGKYVCNTLQLPPAQADPKAVASYERYAKRILWIDDNVVQGSFQLNASWYFRPNMYIISEAADSGAKFLEPHKHDVDEIVAFYGSDPGHPEALNGEIIFYIGGEKHVFTKSCMIFLPAGLEHGPLVIQKIDRPVFHFSCVMQSSYEAEVTK
ncbi:MAG: hypothetical protein IJM80_01795 [Firmicutes bacterium]|nr:hypothetical protein [Bacillota bacterium]